MKRQGWILLSALSMGCSAASVDDHGTSGDQPVQELKGAVLAEVPLSPTHRVQFIELDDGKIVVSETGEQADLKNMLDRSEIAGYEFSEQYRILADRAKISSAVPEPLRVAELRLAQLSPEAQLDTPLAPKSAPQTDALSGLEPRGGQIEKGKLQQGLDWNADALWWQTNFCSTAYADATWCPTNTTWAHSGSSQTMYFESVCLAASQTASANFWVDIWTTSGWARTVSVQLAPRHWQRFIDENIVTRRSGCDGAAADPRVDFSVRIRRSPSALTQLTTSPYDRSREIDNDHQGSANDGGNWYFTSAMPQISGPASSRVWKIPIGTPVGTDSPALRYGNPWNKVNPDGKRYDHFGDPVWVPAYGVLAVPLESTGRVSASQHGHGAIGFMNSDLQYFGYASLPEGQPADSSPDGCAWVGWNPQEGLLYSSVGNYWLTKYRIVSISPPQLAYVDRVRLKDTFGNNISVGYISGGEFSNSGKLYLTQNSGSDGLDIIDPYSGRLHAKRWFDMGDANEIEGVTIWDLDADQRDPNIHGQIHVSLIQNEELSNDDFFYQHFRTTTIGNL